MSHQPPPSPDFSRRRLSNKTYGRRYRTAQAGSTDRAGQAYQREPSTSPLTSPPPSSVTDDVEMQGDTLVHETSTRAPSMIGIGRQQDEQEFDGMVAASEQGNVASLGTGKVEGRLASLRPSLKRARPPSMADLTKQANSQSTKRGRLVDETDNSSGPIPIPSSSAYSFRPIPINDLVPLSTPPDLEGAASLRARQAAHTPRTPPRDLTDLFLRKPSPSPEGRKQPGEPIPGDALRLDHSSRADIQDISGGPFAVTRPGPLRKGRRKMMTRTESLGEQDELFSGHRGKKGDEDEDFPLPIIDSWELSSPERPHLKLPGSGSGPSSPAGESPTTPRQLGRSFSHVSPSARDPKTPSPPRRQAGLGRTSSLPESPSGKPVLRHSLSSGAALTGLIGASAGGPGRAIRTYGRRQASSDDVAAQSISNKAAQQPRSSLNKETVFSDPPSDGLENEINGFLLSPPQAHSIFKPLGDTAVPVQEDSYAELNKRYGVDVADEDDWDPDSQGSMGDLKAPPSLADLRSRGENRRFMDELGYLRDGVQGDSLASRRSSAIDILSKCADAAWFERLRVCGQIESIYEDFAKAGKDRSDEALDLVLLLYLAHLSRSLSDLNTVIQGHAREICKFLANTIQERRISLVQSASSRRKKNPSMDLLRAVRSDLIAPGLTEEARSPLGMACGIFSVVLGHAVERGMDPSNLVDTSEVVVVMTSAIQQELGILPHRLELYKKGLEMFTADQQPDFIAVFDSIQLVQMLITESSECKLVLQDNHVALAPLLSDLLLLISLDNLIPTLSTSQVEELTSQTLKLLLALTQDSPAWSSALLQGTAPYVALLRLLLGVKVDDSLAMGDVSSRRSDTTVTSWKEDVLADETEITNLALGCLFNLVQEDPDHGQVILALAIGKACSGSRKCVEGCHCPGKRPAIDQLVQVFLNQQAHKAEDAGAEFLSGYLALLFANMVDGKPSAATQLLCALGEQDKQSKIDLLINNIQEFRSTYEKFQLHLTKGLQQRLAPTAGKDLEIVVDDRNSSNMIHDALKTYESLKQ